MDFKVGLPQTIHLGKASSRQLSEQYGFPKYILYEPVISFPQVVHRRSSAKMQVMGIIRKIMVVKEIKVLLFIVNPKYR
jgi:hypothetical protein